MKLVFKQIKSICKAQKNTAHTWQLYAKYGVEVALGTDSVASGETLSIYDEALAALEIQGAGLGWRNIVRYASRGGYKALGMKTPTVHRGDSFSSLSVWQ
jgi:aminodeoxyfutalosine deaminase